MNNQIGMRGELLIYIVSHASCDFARLPFKIL
jgi:hypothetical protein